MVGGPGCLWNRAKPHLAQSGRSQPEAPRVSETKAVADGSSTRLCMTFIELFRAPVPSVPFGAVRCQVLLFHQMERHPQKKKRKKEKAKRNHEPEALRRHVKDKRNFLRVASTKWCRCQVCERGVRTPLWNLKCTSFKDLDAHLHSACLRACDQLCHLLSASHCCLLSMSKEDLN